jgi:hypothetical protein
MPSPDCHWYWRRPHPSMSDSAVGVAVVEHLRQHAEGQAALGEPQAGQIAFRVEHEGTPAEPEGVGPAGEAGALAHPTGVRIREVVRMPGARRYQHAVDVAIDDAIAVEVVPVHRDRCSPCAAPGWRGEHA